MDKVEEDLIRSKSLRENQSKEFSQQLDALRQKYEQQIAPHSSPALNSMQCPKIGPWIEQAPGIEAVDLRFSGRPGLRLGLHGGMVWGSQVPPPWGSGKGTEPGKDLGLGALLPRLTSQQVTPLTERQWEVSSLERQARAALQQHQQNTQEWRKLDAQPNQQQVFISSPRLRLSPAWASLKLCGTPFDKPAPNWGCTISDLESQLSSLSEDLHGANEKHKQQLAEMALLREDEKQREFLDREASLDRLRSDMERIRGDHEESHQQEKDAAQEKANSRLKQIEKEYSQKLAKSAQALQEKVESLQRQLHSSEKKLLSKELESEEKVTVVRQEYEKKIKGLMPSELRKELEDTISSLKAQVNFLQKRASLLQEDLDACRSRR
ncbi:hypothetical protein KUCAC02_007966 [Chaenocephalus aceratus]|uniref:Uncharacterized protein n=1 Tax=Chaenocephalus aceratus TaxID=36190 RepID=A0ACB9X8N9_CHAAC|nr:hypothetical protein KUCAC02_007966 [Chaenocephalus aceratus]